MMTKSNGTEARVQVAVRARPLSQREVTKNKACFHLIRFATNFRLISNLRLFFIFMAHKFWLINLKKSTRLLSFILQFILRLLDIIHPKHFPMIFVLIQCG